jgi:uncharacterized protein YdhG (YjbR/CyaY superfamily)
MKFSSIDEYHAGFPEEKQKLMRQLRAAIKAAAPKATECISYNMPAFKQEKVLCYYAAHKNHIGFYPTSAPIAALKDELKKYKTSKGAIQFPLTKSIPSTLVKKILKHRLGYIKAKYNLV